MRNKSLKKKYSNKNEKSKRKYSNKKIKQSKVNNSNKKVKQSKRKYSNKKIKQSKRKYSNKKSKKIQHGGGLLEVGDIVKAGHNKGVVLSFDDEGDPTITFPYNKPSDMPLNIKILEESVKSGEVEIEKAQVPDNWEESIEKLKDEARVAKEAQVAEEERVKATGSLVEYREHQEEKNPHEIVSASGEVQDLYGYYKIMGLKPQKGNEYVDENTNENINLDGLKKKFRGLALHLHPDKGGTREEFNILMNAYHVLRNPVEKRKYDVGVGVVSKPTYEETKEFESWIIEDLEEQIKIFQKKLESERDQVNILSKEKEEMKDEMDEIVESSRNVGDQDEEKNYRVAELEGENKRLNELIKEEKEKREAEITIKTKGLVNELEHSKTELETVNNQLKSLQSEHDRIDEEGIECDKRIAQQKSLLDDTISTLKTETSELREAWNNEEEARQNAQKNERASTRELEENSQRLNEIEAKLQEKQLQLDGKEKELEKKEAEITGKDRQIKEFEVKLNVYNYTGRLQGILDRLRTIKSDTYNVSGNAGQLDEIDAGDGVREEEIKELQKKYDNLEINYSRIFKEKQEAEKGRHDDRNDYIKRYNIILQEKQNDRDMFKRRYDEVLKRASTNA